MSVCPARDPEVIAEEMAQPWLLKAACAGLSSLLSDPDREREAVDLCVLHCPVKVDCYRWVFALSDRDDPGGVCAGWSQPKRMAERQRRRVLAARRRKKEAAEREAAEREAADLERLRRLPLSELVAEVVARLAEQTRIPATRRPALREVPQPLALPQQAADVEAAREAA